MQIINTHQASNQLRTLLNVIQEGNAITVTRDNRNVAIQLLGGEEKLNQLRVESMKKNREELKKAFNDIREEFQGNGLAQEILDDILNNV